MTGYEKIAILLTELGSETSEKILSILKLSPAQMNKISKNIMTLGSYNPRNLLHVQRETAVLEEVKKFGELRGIYREVAPQNGGFIMVDDNLENLKKEIPKSPEDVANLLRGWLDS
ncbi:MULTISPECIES: hypothetical protein [unclassified Treponema]|uniref:hypothetical protein n=1 Tax=unclassified Treponema TaxID=2638727 RepID=UPI0025D000B6|nr:MULTISPECIES: hypothetical protein [unclassified Treponema]MBQ8678488.1 hypothetical protein [Treponema sp.]